MHILLIEPDRQLSTTYGDVLRRAGHTVAICHEPQSAVHMADRQRPDLVVLELQTPRHSGIEFLYEFRSYPEWQNIPVVVQTFVPRHSLAVQQFEQLGVTQYLYKPAASLQQLMRAVNQTLPVGT